MRQDTHTPLVSTQNADCKILKFIYTENMKTIKIQQRGLLTLPKKLRDALALEEGQILRVTQDGQRIILEPQPASVDRELATAITQGIADIKAGKYIEFSSTRELHQKLKRYEN